MRALFVDGWNSFWHIAFGMLSVPVPLLIPFFLLYQFVLKYDGNSMIDTLEFVIGAVAYLVVSYVASLKVVHQFRLSL
jgi:hypothetical protein